MVVNSNATTTKEAIIITAQQLFHEKGYDHVSLRDIASACGISPGNLSYHFKKKENLVVAVMENVYEGAYHDIAVGTDSTVSALLAHLTAQDERCQRYPFYFRDLLLLGESFPQIKDRQVRLREQNYFFYIRTFHALRINGLPYIHMPHAFARQIELVVRIALATMYENMLSDFVHYEAFCIKAVFQRDYKAWRKLRGGYLVKEFLLASLAFRAFTKQLKHSLLIIHSIQAKHGKAFRIQRQGF